MSEKVGEVVEMLSSTVEHVVRFQSAKLVTRAYTVFLLSRYCWMEWEFKI